MYMLHQNLCVCLQSIADKEKELTDTQKQLSDAKEQQSKCQSKMDELEKGASQVTQERDEMQKRVSLLAAAATRLSHCGDLATYQKGGC